MSKAQVAILMGSKTDMPVMEEAANVLQEFDVAYEMKVLSAHRTPLETAEYAQKAAQRGIKIFLCGAGGAAALAGVVAAHAILPVIGVPVDSTSLNGIDSLLSTVQMPPGVPVATVAIGRMGAKNAAFLALRILGLSDKSVEDRLVKYREKQRREILEMAVNQRGSRKRKQKS